MFRQVARKSLTLSLRNNETYLRRLSTSYAHEELTYEDQSLFPAEEGIVQNSIYGDRLLVPKCTLDQYVWSDLAKFKHKTAIECGVTGKSFTYEKLRDHSAAFAVNLIKKLKIVQGQTVAICLPNIPEFAIAALGGIESGAVISTLNPIYTSDEISKQLINSDTKVLIGGSDKYETLRKAVELSKNDIKIVIVKMEDAESLPSHVINFNEMIDTTGVSFDVLTNRTFDPNDTVMLPYSSGTTGVPKGVELTHRNIISNSEMLSVVLGSERVILETTDTYQDVLPCVLPFFHIYGWTGTFVSKLKLGCKLVTLPAFHPKTFVNVLSKYNPTVLHLVPPIVNFMVNSNDVTRDNLKTVRMIMSGAAPLGRSEVDRLTESKAPQVHFAQGYGLTETSPVALAQSIGSTNFSSVGSPVAVTQAKIADLNDPELVGLGPNQKGEILVRGPHIMKGYYKNEAATKETIVKNGWLRTGDIGYYDDEFQFYITDRLKELIKVKGFQVAPAELEELLKCHPDVADAAVIGVPHKSSGEAPRGYIVAKPNAKVNTEDILKFVKSKVTSYKHLESVVVIDAIPKNATGKIMRRELKAKYVQ